MQAPEDRQRPAASPASEARRAAALTRRDLARGLLVASCLPLLAPLSGCARTQNRAGGRDAALLLPLTGDAATLGQNMASAATLVNAGRPEAQPPVYDTMDTADGARAAAERALAGGARMLLGPLRADQTPAVLAVAGGVPVVTFSNDDRLTAQGAFVMGITPAQSVAAAFSYARAEGAQRVALVARPGPLGEASAAAARQLAAAGGLTLTAVLLREDAGGLAQALRAASGGSMPDAVFLPDGGPALLAFAGALPDVQLMGGVQWGVLDVASSTALSGAWFAAPPPATFIPFLDTFQNRFGAEAGVVTALGHDAALLAAELGNAGKLDRSGLTRQGGFTGALGGFRFAEDGRCLRDLAILTLENAQIVSIGEVAGT